MNIHHLEMLQLREKKIFQPIAVLYFFNTHFLKFSSSQTNHLDVSRVLLCAFS